MKLSEPKGEGFATPINDSDEFMTAGSAMQVITAVVTSIGCQIGSDKVFDVLEEVVGMRAQLVKLITGMKKLVDQQGPGKGHLS